MKIRKLGSLKLAVKSGRRDQAFEAGQTDKTGAGDAHTLSRMILIYNIYLSSLVSRHQLLKMQGTPVL
jgi:hypothetical protein